MKTVVLYTRPSCHLCDEARRVIVGVLGAAVAEVDIADCDDLMVRYETRIPVLRRTDTGVEIGWPFGPEEVWALLKSVR